MLLTRRLINKNKTLAGGFNKAQLKALGIKWPPAQGWVGRLDGTQITDEKWQEFLEAKEKCKRNKKVSLTADEVTHILDLIQDSEQIGEYRGNRENYWKVSAEITAKLTQ